MKKPVLFALSALVAGAMSLPVYAAGTNEKNPDSAATGMTGSGSNATDPNGNMDRSATGASSTGSDTSADTGTTHVKKAKRKARHMKKAPDAATNHGAVGGESAGKSSDSPSQ